MRINNKYYIKNDIKNKRPVTSLGYIKNNNSNLRGPNDLHSDKDNRFKNNF